MGIVGRFAGMSGGTSWISNTPTRRRYAHEAARIPAEYWSLHGARAADRPRTGASRARRRDEGVSLGFCRSGNRIRSGADLGSLFELRRSQHLRIAPAVRLSRAADRVKASYRGRDAGDLVGLSHS